MQIKKEVKIGIYAVVIIAGMYWLFNFLKGKDLFDTHAIYYVHYESVDGLSTASPVFLKGLKIGAVSDIAYEEDGQQFLVSLQVEKAYRIPDNSVAQIFSTGLMSGNGVRILIGDSPVIAASRSRLESSIAPDIISSLAPLQEQAELLLANLNTTITAVNNILTDDTQKNLEASVSSLQKSLQHIEHITGALGAKNGHLNNTLENLDAFSSALRNNSDHIDTIAANFSQFSDTLRRLNIKATIDRLNVVLAQAGDSSGTIGQLLQNDELYRHLSAMLNNLDELIKDLQKNPKKYVRLSLF
ncbi:MAG: MlaD family protein [Prevotellaceae bacterium]|jgi:phospholipid/cholesterol/gamma-HCH transport system substrate-binding protein|nr:MlaD family protein [Prevotellaceae bacterium]